ncbi:universal stress protein [Streptomyces sp. LP05-1]|uniref:Universal stress protein n=1 Tax=Streptomyces pyxinae TaxID=2970734 RepID=A0ABT2CHL8_9ACTN|nr:universal stress protein [Streptomyces sp. LP05-1]MCS0636898.1 universal stress protein [Streptomyces sp. LP05-1]
MSRTVVVGLDGSAASLAAVEWAAREAEARDLPLRLVHATEDWAAPYGQTSLERTYDPTHWAERITREAAEGVSERHPGVKVEVERVAGRAFGVLMDEAKDAALLVLGSRRLTAFTGFLTGSVSMSVLAHAVCPVVLVRAAAPVPVPAAAPAARAAALTAADGTAADRSGAPATRSGAAGEAGPEGEVVLGVDLSKPCDDVIAYAFGAAALRGAALRVVYGWSMPPVFGYDPAALDPAHAGDLAARHAVQLRRVLGPWRRAHPEVTVIEQCVVGAPAEHLAEAAVGASLVVLGRRIRRSAFGLRIGPVTHAVLHHAAPPVVVVPHD